MKKEEDNRVDKYLAKFFELLSVARKRENLLIYSLSFLFSLFNKKNFTYLTTKVVKSPKFSLFFLSDTKGSQFRLINVCLGLSLSLKSNQNFFFFSCND